MKTHRITAFAAVFALLAVAATAGLGAGRIVAADTPPNSAETPPETLTLTTQYPVVKAPASGATQFAVDLKYTGTQPKLFDLSAKGPETFTVSVQPQFQSTDITAVRVDPAISSGETFNLVATPTPWNLPAPGRYVFSMAAASGQLAAEVQITLEVVPNYGFTVKSTSGETTMEAATGQENHFSINLSNTGTVVLKNISFSSTNPEGWTIRFNPGKIESMAVNGIRDVDVIVQPPPGTVPGDYKLTFKAQDDSGEARGTQDVRVTVVSASIWGWVWVGVLAVVIGGAAYSFVRLGRR